MTDQGRFADDLTLPGPAHAAFVRATEHSMPLLELAQRLPSADLRQELAGGLDTVAKFISPQMSFPNGCHFCEVEIDPDTGVVAVVGSTTVDDVGNMLHEAIVRGQIHGGVAQGLGQVLGERIVYSQDCQLLTASFMDYAIPRADDLASLSVHHHAVPLHHQPAGRQRRRRIRHRRLPAVRGERRARCACQPRRHQPRPVNAPRACLVHPAAGRCWQTLTRLRRRPARSVA